MPRAPPLPPSLSPPARSAETEAALARLRGLREPARKRLSRCLAPRLLMKLGHQLPLFGGRKGGGGDIREGEESDRMSSSCLEINDGHRGM